MMLSIFILGLFLGGVFGFLAGEVAYNTPHSKKDSSKIDELIRIKDNPFDNARIVKSSKIKRGFVKK